MKKKLNAPLLAGGLILLLLVSIIVMPGIYTKYNPYGTETLKSYQDDSGNFKFMTPPFAPDERHKLGTDEMGRDVISLIVYGARLTIGISLVVVFFRFSISLLIGITAAFGNPLAQGSIRLSNIIFNFVPPLIICLIILKIRFFESLPKELSFWMFVFMLTLVGWSRVAEVVQSRSEDILRQDFIRSEISIGKNRGMIALTNVVPHLAAEITVMAFMEIAVVLGLLMQLGAFMVFIGNMRIVENSDHGVIVSKPMSFEPEWAAMMGASKTYLRSAPWLVFSPAVAFFISILGFNMFGEGLRKALQAQNSKFMTSVNKYVKPAIAGISILILITVVSQISTAVVVLESPEVVPPGNVVRQGDETAAQWLEERMKMLGLKPLKEAYQHKYEFAPYWMTESSELAIGENISLSLGEDYIIAGYGDGSYSGDLYDGRMLDVIGFESPDLRSGQVLLLDGSHYRVSMIEAYIEHIQYDNNLSAVIVLMPNLIGYESLGTFHVNYPVAFVKSEMDLEIEDEIKTKSKVTLNLSCFGIEGKGINVLGMLEGQEDKANDEAIIIGVEYNYESNNQQAGLISVLELMEAFSKINDQLERRVIFAFWDGKYNSSGYGVQAYMKHPLYQPKDTAAYIDISAQGHKGQVVYDDSHAPHTRFYGWSLTQRAQKIGDSVGLKMMSDLTEVRPDIYSRGPSSIHVQLRPSENESENSVDVEAFAGFIYDLILGGGY